VFVSDFNNFLHFLVHLIDVWNQKHCTACQIINKRVHVNCETKRETKYTETKRNETKRNGIIQNEIKPILTKQFLGERQDKN
jgi:hypothetical protein